MEKENKKGNPLFTIISIAFFFWIIFRIGSSVGKYLAPYGVPTWVTGVAAIVVIVALFLKMMKAALIKGMPQSFEPITTTPDWHPWLDRGDLDKYTQEFEPLGFQHLQDFTTKTEGSTAMNGFARLWVHPEHNCMAEVNQIITAQGTKSPVRSVVTSRFDDDWTLSTTDRKPEGTNWVLRRPKGVWSSHPDASPQELLRIHLQGRDDFINGLRVKLDTDLSMEAYTRNQQQFQKDINELMKRKFIVTILMEILLFPRNPKSEWRGALSKVSKKR